MLFNIIDRREEGKGIALGLNIRIGNRDYSIPITTYHMDPEGLKKELKELIREIEDLISEIMTLSEKAQGPEAHIDEEQAVDKIWDELSKLRDEERFVEVFNSLSDAKRKEIAEYVFSRCNVFQGMAAVFSSRYNSESSKME